MTAEDQLVALRADACRGAPDPPGLDELIEDTGRERLAAYYLYCALLAGVIGDDGLPPERWPPELAEPMARLGLTRFAPRTGRGLDARLAPAEQVTRRNRGRQLEFARLLVDLINHGAFGPLCGNAQYLAGVPLRGTLAAGNVRGSKRTTARRLKDSGVAHAVSLGVTLAVGLHPVGTIAGLGTRLIQVRIQAGQDQADALRNLGRDLRALCAQADGELTRLQAGKSI
jgi:hypothetical protein